MKILELPLRPYEPEASQTLTERNLHLNGSAKILVFPSKKNSDHVSMIRRSLSRLHFAQQDCTELN